VGNVAYFRPIPGRGLNAHAQDYQRQNPRKLSQGCSLLVGWFTADYYWLSEYSVADHYTQLYGSKHLLQASKKAPAQAPTSGASPSLI